MGVSDGTLAFAPIRWSIAFLGVLLGFLLFFGGLQVLMSSLKSERWWLERTLLRRAESPFLSFVLGTLITAIVQSSSLATVVTVALVDAGLLSLETSIPVILGANVGTTITAYLITMDLRSWATVLLSLGLVLLATGGFGSTRDRTRSKSRVIAGVAPQGSGAKGSKRRHSRFGGSTYRVTGVIEGHHLAGGLIGAGLIFFGLDLISKTALPLTTLLSWNRIISSPLTGLFWGIAATGLVQSSSVVTVAVAIIARGSTLTPRTTLPLVLGANIGTCVTALIASLGRSKAARQAALAHLLINCMGVAAALLVFEPLSLVVGLTSEDPARQVANGHMLFNIFNTVLIYPFVPELTFLVRLLTGEPVVLRSGCRFKAKMGRKAP